MFKAIKRLITSGLKPHSCKLCITCYVCHGCLLERNQIRQCCYDVTEEEIDILREELRNNFSLIYPVRKHYNNTNANPTQTKNVGDSKKHRANSRARSSFKCNICGKSFKKEFTLTRHFNAHARVGEKFKCQTCKKCFAISKDLQSHSKIHHNVEDKSRVCMHCDKEFSSWHNLKVHMRRHKSYRPYKCNLCSNDFTTQSMLNIHYRSHAILKTASVESFTNASTDSELDILEDENDSLNAQSFTLENFEPAQSNSEKSDNQDLENFEPEQSNSGKSDNQDLISNLSDQFNPEDDFDDDEVSKKNFQLSLDKDMDLKTHFEEDVIVKKSYKAPLVIKLKPSG